AGLALGVAVCTGITAPAFIPWRGRPAFEALPSLAGYPARRTLRQHRRLAPIPLAPIPAPASGSTPSVPPCLHGLEILSATGDDDTPVGYVHDRARGTLSAVVPVRGSEFALLDPDDQHQRIAAWGRILSQLARDSTRVRRVCWYEHCTTGTV